MSNCSKWLATPNRLVLLNIVIGFKFKDKCFKLFNECVIIGTLVKSLSAKFNSLKELKFVANSWGIIDNEFCANDKETKRGRGRTGT